MQDMKMQDLKMLDLKMLDEEIESMKHLFACSVFTGCLLATL